MLTLFLFLALFSGAFSYSALSSSGTFSYNALSTFGSLSSPDLWSVPKFEKLLDSCFETGFEMSYLSAEGGKQTASGSIVYDHGKFRAESSDCQFVYDGKALCIIYKESREVLIDKYDGIKSVISAIIGQNTSVKPYFSGDRLTSMRIETENGTAINVTVPSFRYLSNAEDSSYFKRLQGQTGNRSDKLFVVDCASLESKGYVVTDLR